MFQPPLHFYTSTSPSSPTRSATDTVNSQSAAVLVGIGHSTNSVGLLTTASSDLFYIELYDD